MDQQYEVTIGGKQAGKVSVRRQGLYYCFSCRCCLAGDIIYRLVVSSGSARENLGILVPDKGGFVLETRLPVKRIGEGPLSFRLVPKREEQVSFLPIRPEEPFAYLSRLKQSFLVISNGEPGICIGKMQE